MCGFKNIHSHFPRPLTKGTLILIYSRYADALSSLLGIGDFKIKWRDGKENV